MLLAALSALLRSGANKLTLRTPLGLPAVNSLGLVIGLMVSRKAAAGAAADAEVEPGFMPDCEFGFAACISEKLAAGSEAFKLDFVGLNALGDLGVCICMVVCDMLRWHAEVHAS